MEKPGRKNSKSSKRKVDIHSNSDLDYWTKRLGCTAEQLKQVVLKVGSSPVKVIRELEK